MPKSPNLTQGRRRGARADSLEFAKSVAESITLEPLMPLCTLSERAQRHWPRIIGAKRRELWTPTDLDTAGRLCEMLAKVDVLWSILKDQSSIIKDEKGRLRDHPALVQARELERDIQATKRHLQINSAAVNGPSHHLAGKNEAARTLEAYAAEDDDLFARPDRKG